MQWPYPPVSLMPFNPTSVDLIPSFSFPFKEISPLRCANMKIRLHSNLDSEKEQKASVCGKQRYGGGGGGKIILDLAEEHRF